MSQRAAPLHDSGPSRRPAAAHDTCSKRSRLTSSADTVAATGLVVGRAGNWSCRSGTVSLKVHHYFLLSQIVRLRRPGFFYREEARLLAWGA